MTEQQAHQNIDELTRQLHALELNRIIAYMSGANLTYTLGAEAKIKAIEAKIAHAEQFIEEV
jgi:uncharacterized coiled-coil protein SlyX